MVEEVIIVMLDHYNQVVLVVEYLMLPRQLVVLVIHLQQLLLHALQTSISGVRTSHGGRRSRPKRKYRPAKATPIHLRPAGRASALAAARTLAQLTTRCGSCWPLVQFLRAAMPLIPSMLQA